VRPLIWIAAPTHNADNQLGRGVSRREPRSWEFGVGPPHSFGPADPQRQLPWFRVPKYGICSLLVRVPEHAPFQNITLARADPIYLIHAYYYLCPPPLHSAYLRSLAACQAIPSFLFKPVLYLYSVLCLTISHTTHTTTTGTTLSIREIVQVHVPLSCSSRIVA
jgi:hypothetical protein